MSNLLDNRLAYRSRPTPHPVQDEMVPHLFQTDIQVRVRLLALVYAAYRK